MTKMIVHEKGPQGIEVKWRYADKKRNLISTRGARMLRGMLLQNLFCNKLIKAWNMCANHDDARVLHEFAFQEQEKSRKRK